MLVPAFDHTDGLLVLGLYSNFSAITSAYTMCLWDIRVAAVKECISTFHSSPIHRPRAIRQRADETVLVLQRCRQRPHRVLLGSISPLHQRTPARLQRTLGSQNGQTE